MTLSKTLSGCQVFDASELPVDWDCLALGERIELRYGRALREEDRKQGQVDVFGSNGKVGTHDVDWLPPPGIVVGRKGTVGAVHYSVRPYWPIDTAYYVKPLRSDKTAYLYYLLKFLPLTFLNAATGVPGLSRRDVYALRGAFPTPEEQTLIAEVLGAVDTVLDHARSAVEWARQLDHSLLHELLARGTASAKGAMQPHPPHWTVRRLDEVADVGSGVTLGQDVSGFESVERPYLRVANVQDGHLDLSTVKTVRVRRNNVENYQLQADDVLMTEGGDIDKLGRGTIWDGQIPGCLHQNHIFRIRADRAALEPMFYALVVESDIAKRYFNRVAKRTTNLASTNKTQVRRFKFPLPPTLDEQREIVAVMKESKATIAALAAQEVALSGLKTSLMNDMFRARVRVTSLIPAAAS